MSEPVGERAMVSVDQQFSAVRWGEQWMSH